jgi:hypothetical protein
MPASAGQRQRPTGYCSRRSRVIAPLELVAVVVVLAAVMAMAIWFFFFAHGGLLPGTL